MFLPVYTHGGTSVYHLIWRIFVQYRVCKEFCIRGNLPTKPNKVAWNGLSFMWWPCSFMHSHSFWEQMLLLCTANSPFTAWHRACMVGFSAYSYWKIRNNFYVNFIFSDCSQRLTDQLADWLTSWLTDWLSGLLTDWLANWLKDWLADWLAACLPVCLPAWLTGWPAGWLTDWLTDLLAGWKTDWLTGWLTDWLGLADWQTGWLTGWLDDWLTVWLTDWFFRLLTHPLNER